MFICSTVFVKMSFVKLTTVSLGLGQARCAYLKEKLWNYVYAVIQFGSQTVRVLSRASDLHSRNCRCDRCSEPLLESIHYFHPYNESYYVNFICGTRRH